jgi:c-di-GMP phosphodiesterase
MAGWFKRLLGSGDDAPAAVAAVAPEAQRERVAASPHQSQRAAAPERPLPSVAPQVAAAPPPPASFGVRRPMVGSTGSVAAFEMMLPPVLEARLAQRGDVAARAAHLALLLAAAVPLCKSGRSALIGISAAVLLRPGVAQQAPTGSLLCVQDLALLPPALVQDLRSRGVFLGVPDDPSQAQSLPTTDFVLFQPGSGSLDTLLASAQQWRQSRPRLPLLASGLQDLEDVEHLLRSGFTLAGGLLDRSRGMTTGKALSASAHRICELLNHLALDRDTRIVAQSVRADVALSYRLLRYANSPAVGVRRAVESVDDAVMLLGRQELQRWLNMLLLSVSESRQASRAVQEMALARGRLFEKLAQQKAEPAPQNLFTMGLMSMLEVLLQVPLADALRPLRLSEPVLQALLQRQGPYAVYLELAEALDAVDAARIDALARQFGGNEAVQEMADKAWAWAGEVAAAASQVAAPERDAAAGPSATGAGNGLRPGAAAAPPSRVGHLV